MNNGDLIAHFLGFFEVMGGENHSHSVRIELAHIVPKHLAQADIHPRSGLIEYQDLRAMYERFAQEQPPAHAT